MERVKKGEEYWFIDRDGEILWRYDGYSCQDDMMFDYGNYFHTKEEAEAMAKKLRAVLKGAEIIEDWQKEKIKSWDTMLETKDEMGKSLSSLLNNPKIKAVLNGAEAIEMPSEEEISTRPTQTNPFDTSEREGTLAGYTNGAHNGYIKGYSDCLKWLKSKIIK